MLTMDLSLVNLPAPFPVGKDGITELWPLVARILRSVCHRCPPERVLHRCIFSQEARRRGWDLAPGIPRGGERGTCYSRKQERED